MSTFALLHGSILRSSVWVSGSKEERLVWITILALKDRDGIVRSSLVGLAYAAKVSNEECAAAIEKFTNPDPDDTSKVDEGRRLREVPGGWQVVNHDYYRFSSEERRELWRQTKAAERLRKALDAKAPEKADGKLSRYPKRTKEERRAAREKEKGVNAGADRHENDPTWMQTTSGDLSESTPAAGGQP